VTYGATIDAAIVMAREAIEGYLESMKEHGEEVPTEEGTLEYTVTVEANV
jgi:predicted RNase H-like HicB family nuclease